jgi:hypothetical protein
MNTTRHTVENLPIGTAIYYTGDAANHGGFGAVIAHRPASRWAGASVDIRMDDGREWLGVHPVSFDRSPGRRFMLASTYQAERQAAIEQMRADLERLRAAGKL